MRIGPPAKEADCMATARFRRDSGARIRPRRAEVGIASAAAVSSVGIIVSVDGQGDPGVGMSEPLCGGENSAAVWHVGTSTLW